MISISSLDWNIEECMHFCYLTFTNLQNTNRGAIKSETNYVVMNERHMEKVLLFYNGGQTLPMMEDKLKKKTDGKPA